MPGVPANTSPYRRPVIDAHTHPMLPGEAPIGKEPHDAAEYLKRAAGIDLRFIAALVMAPRDDLAGTRVLNDKVLALGQQSQGRFYPVCSVHPLDGARALAELDRVANAGSRALKLHPNTQQFDVADPAVLDTVVRATAHNLPVLFDAYSPFDADQPGKFVRMAMAAPRSRLILAHAHGPRFPDLMVYDFLARYPWWQRNVWIDISAISALLAGGPFVEQFVWVCRKVGTDRLLFGSDYPIVDPKPALEAVLSLGFTEPELSQILYDNAAELFGFPAAHPRVAPTPALDSVPTAPLAADGFSAVARGSITTAPDPVLSERLSR